MNLPLWAVCSITISCLTVALAAESQPNSKKNNPKNPLSDGIDIDDEDMEGSGEEDPRDLESSGSGFGPDDEDTAPGSDTDSKRGQGRDNRLIPRPGSTSSSSSPTLVKHLPESGPDDDENSRANPAEPGPHENKNILRNNQPDGSESDSDSRSLFPKEPFDSHHPDEKNYEDNKSDSSVVSKVNTPDRDRATSFFAQPGILAAVIGGAVVGLLCAILVVMFIVYRMRKKDEGSYPLEEMKRCPASNPYMKPNHREFFA